jgi:hypothetical protein
MELTVFIPTRGRTGAGHTTLNELKKFSEMKPIVVCPENEAGHYRSYGYVVMPCPLIGIGPTRQWILENSPSRGVVMFDDDMYFSFRPTPNEPVLERITDMMPMFSWISGQLDGGFPHGGISARQGNQHIPRKFADCIRVNNCHFFDRDLFLATKIRFDALPVMEDFYVSLSLLLMGYPNRVSYHYCWSQRGSGAKGGCSLYRTSAMQADAANQLHALFPEFVKVVTKTSISGSGLFAGQRTDVNIAWLKAWASRNLELGTDHSWYATGTPDLARR